MGRGRDPIQEQYDDEVRAAWWRRDEAWAAELDGRCLPASVGEYASWLAAYLGAGGEVTDIRDYPLAADPVPLDRPTEELRAALAPPTWRVLMVGDVRPLSQQRAFTLIIPTGTRLENLPTDIGHNMLYLMDGPHAVHRDGVDDGGCPVPLYADVAQILGYQPSNVRT